MNTVAKLQVKPSRIADAEDLEDSHDGFSEAYLEFEPEAEHLMDAEILGDSFLDDFDDFDGSDYLDDDFGFIPGDD